MARNRIRWKTWVALAVLALSARPTATPAAENLPPAAVKEADTIYQTRCIGCHGPGGKGDGPIGMALNPRPRDLSDEAWQKSVADEHIEKIILGGGPAVGKSPMMPANSDLNAKPDVLKALRAMVRNFGASAGGATAKPAAAH